MSTQEKSYKIESTSNLKELMAQYFQKLQNSNLVAWCTSVGPAELLRSFGFEVYFPENHGALIGTTRTSTDFIPEAVSRGFSSHVCSYTTSDIGSFLAGKTPLTKHYGMDEVPRPDLIVYNTNQCREVEDWFNFYARKFDCPIAGINPPRHLDEVNADIVDLVVKQFQAIIPICEKVSGVKFDIDRYCEVLSLSKDATLLWQKCLRTSCIQPAPLSFFDGTIHMGPIVVMRGTKEAVTYYQRLFDELENNNKNGQGFLAKEECRIFWDGMPIWGKLRMMSDLFAQNNAAVVASTYCSSWIFDSFDEVNPWESTAKAYTEIFINRSEEAKLRMLREWAEEYKVDGIIFHDAKTCFHNSNSRFGLPARFRELTGIPALVIEGDLCDLRFFSEGQTTTKIETFIEQLKEIKFA